MDGQRYRVLISDKARQMMKAHVSFLAEVNPQAAEKLRAVSYTHLDVYKRQALYRGGSSCAAAEGAGLWG